MRATKNIHTVITDGRRIKEFLNDPAVNEVFEGLAEALFIQWMESTDITVREALHAEARAVLDLQTSLRVIVGTGEHEEAALAQREKAANPRPEAGKIE